MSAMFQYVGFTAYIKDYLKNDPSFTFIQRGEELLLQKKRGIFRKRKYNLKEVYKAYQNLVPVFTLVTSMDHLDPIPASPERIKWYA